MPVSNFEEETRLAKRADYVVNPACTIAIKIKSRVRGQPCTEFQIGPDRNRELAKFLIEIDGLKKRKLSDLPLRLRRQLDFMIETGICVPANEVPQSVSPAPSLSRSLLPFVPKSARAAAAAPLSSGNLRFDRDHVFFQVNGERPTTAIPGIPPWGDYPHGPSFVWVYDPGTQMWAAYKAAPNMIALLEDCRAEPSSIGKLDSSTRELLWHARILNTHARLEQQTVFWKQGLARAAHTLKTEGYAVVRGLITPLQTACLRLYVRQLEAEGYLKQFKEQTRRLWRHDDPVLSFVHRQTGSLFRRLTRSAVIPSYSFLSAYLEAADLKKHTDRPQCIWNASLLLDAKPEVDVADSWPIYLETPKAVREVKLDLGDCVVYRGQEIPHWRPPQPPGSRSTLSLFHYVPIEFTGSLG